MKLDIITPDKKLFSDKIFLVQLPGSKGSFEILDNHAPIISTLEEGTIKVIDKGNKVVFIDISGGVVECHNNKTVVLVQSGKISQR